MVMPQRDDTIEESSGWMLCLSMQPCVERKKSPSAYAKNCVVAARNLIKLRFKEEAALARGRLLCVIGSSVARTSVFYATSCATNRSFFLKVWLKSTVG